MTYTTQQALEDHYTTEELVRLTDIGRVATGVVDSTRVSAAITSVQAKIDGYIGKRYVLPLTEVPPLIGRIARAMVYHELHLVEPDEKATADHKEALADLTKIAEGKVSLPVAERTAPETGSTGARVTDRERPMTEHNLKGLI